MIENHHARPLTEEEVDAVAKWLNESVDWETRYKDAMRLFESLTPMGSEFYHDPKACHDWVERELRFARQATKEMHVTINHSRLASWAYQIALRKRARTVRRLKRRNGV
jgi:hypothetical protein